MRFESEKGESVVEGGPYEGNWRLLGEHIALSILFRATPTDLRGNEMVRPSYVEANGSSSSSSSSSRRGAICVGGKEEGGNEQRHMVGLKPGN
ncbi:hypothetical protein V1478_008713 [Vespula squamosa]|uniref:Uncharacterized protein n=1 Tax=Vespula squamosa TaxID=30214 RepID=A0ABD2AUP4_VESSQ